MPEPIDQISSASRDAGRVARRGLWTLGLGLGGFALWAALAPLDEGVPAAATVAVETQRQAVQHLSGGIVRQVMVREGQQVQQGQVLYKLDTATAQANLESIRQRYLGFRAIQARLIAEQGAADKPQLHPDLQAELKDPLIRTQWETQLALFQTRQNAHRAELRAIDETIEGQRALLESYVSMQRSRQAQRRFLAEELDNTRPLVAEGYAPRNRQLDIERQLSEMDAVVADLGGRQLQAQRTISELQQRQVVRRNEFRSEVDTQLTSVTQEVQADSDRLKALRAELDRTDILAPVSGQAVGVLIQTVSGVVQPGQKLMDVVPTDASLLLDVRIAPHLIDKVHAGLQTDVRFSSFAHSPQLVVTGQVLSVSQDLLMDPQTGVGYYLARVGLTAEGLKQLGGRQLQAGMPAEVVIKTGERSFLTYLLHPLLKRMASSMKEE